MNLRDRWQKKANANKSFDIVETRYPSHQNAIDSVLGWNHAFQESFGLRAGDAHLYNDERIHWALDQYGSLAGQKILELGPLEASHTLILDRAEPAVLDAVENNQKAYLRCLIAKEVYQLKRARFLLGDFMLLLADNEVSYDLIVASGVLYHMSDPLKFLELIALRTDAVYIWSHYYDEDAMPQNDPRAQALLPEIKVEKRGLLELKLRARSYHGASQNDNFCGGSKDLHYWMSKQDILAYLDALGFDTIKTAHDSTNHVNGPCVSIFARRSKRRFS